MSTEAIVKAQAEIAQFTDEQRVEDRQFIEEELFNFTKEAKLSLLARAIEHGIDLNRRDENGMTVMHHAAVNDARAFILELLRTGRCNLLIKDNFGRYASDIAIEWAKDPALGHLLSKHQAKQALKAGVLPFS